jgi:cell division protein FtsZ
MSIHELNSASSIIYEEAGEEANVILGCVIDENLKDEVRVTVIATGLNENSLEVTDDASKEQMSFIRDRVVENKGDKKTENLSFGDDYEVPTYLRDAK